MIKNTLITFFLLVLLSVNSYSASDSKSISKSSESLKLPTIDSDLPAITHVDGSARVQTVNKDQNQVVYDILSKLHRDNSHPPVLLNTSFNVRGEPIVDTPGDAISCFLDTDIDFLLLGGCLLSKKSKRQKPIRKFEPD